MKMKRFYLFGFLFFFLYLIYLNPSNQIKKNISPKSSISFKRLTVEDGLSQSHINCIIQDSRGFMWFGTSNGVNRWDGNKFNVYFNEANNRNSLSSNNIDFSLVDKKGNLWFITRSGVLNRYNPEIDGFERIDLGLKSPNYGKTIIKVIEDKNDKIWIATFKKGLISFNIKTRSIKKYFKELDPYNIYQANGKTISSFIIGKDGTIWIGTYAGLVRFYPEKKQFYRYPYRSLKSTKAYNPFHLNSPFVINIMEDKSERLWIGSYFGGLQQLNRKEDKFISYPFDSNDPNCFVGNTAFLIFEDHFGSLWVSGRPYNKDFTYKLPGFARLNPDTGVIIRYKADKNNPLAISQDNVFRIMEDSNQRLWIHTFGGGIDLYDPISDSFTNFSFNPKDSSSISDNAITCFFEDKSGTVWVGTETNGVCFYNSAWNKFPHYLVDVKAPYRRSNQMVLRINGSKSSRNSYGSYNNFWISTAAGLNYWDRKKNEFKFYEIAPKTPDAVALSICEDSLGNVMVGSQRGLFIAKLSNLLNEGANHEFEIVDVKNGPRPRYIYTIIPWKKNYFWLGSWDRGLIKFNSKNRKMEFFSFDKNNKNSLMDNRIVHIFPGNNGKLWILTYSGLDLYDPEKNRFKHFYSGKVSFHVSDILWLYEDLKGILWLGLNGNGLEKYDPKSGETDHYMEANGLPDNKVNAILPQYDNNKLILWISTENGLCSFDPELETFKTFDRHDGLQSNEFNGRSAFIADDGEMFFGGVNGFNAFYPKKIVETNYMPPVYITNLKILNETIEPGSRSVLKKPIDISDTINFSYRDRIISFEFSALEYSSPDKIKYACYLDGFESGWNYIQNRRFVTYTNLPPGDYTFFVKSTNIDGIWSPKKTKLNVSMSPAPWRTWWAKTILILLILLFVFGFYTWRIRDIKTQRYNLKKQVAARTKELSKARDLAEHANRVKSLFLANMSHELRTPLNAVLGFSQLMLRDKDLNNVSTLTPNQIENLEIIGRSGRHLLNLINDILEMSKIEAGRISLAENDVNLFEILQNIENMFKIRAEGKSISLKIKISNDTPRFVKTDKKKLEQILLNLIGNAIKFTSEGSVVISVSYSSNHFKQNKPGLIFEIEDTGKGIKPEEIDTIFNPFVQTESDDETEGTGLGLPISKKFVNLMGGDLSVTSELGKGSIFRFDIGIKKSSINGISNSVTRKRAVRIISRGVVKDNTPIKILVVDDVEVSRLLLIKLLTPLGFEVREARNGQEAIKIWRGWHPHLIWMDMRMPVMDGKIATQKIRSEEKNATKTVIIALTASTFEKERKNIIKNGCDDFIRKPFDEEEIFNVMEKHLGLRFEYEKFADIEKKKDDRKDNTKILNAGFKKLPLLMIKELKESSVVLDGDKVLKIIKKIRKEDEDFGLILENLIQNFRFDTILKFIKDLEKKNGKKG